MASGGARASSGPAPDPGALRRGRKDDKASWTTLPADGRTGLAPVWPLAEETVREHDLWRELWRRPQAVVWEAMGQDIEVALFVRYLARAEGAEPSGDVLRLVRQYQESLGLSVAGMLRNRWRIAPVAEVEEDAADEGAECRPSARDRLKVVPDAGGA